MDLTLTGRRTPHANFFQQAQDTCEHDIGKAGNIKEMGEDRLREGPLQEELRVTNLCVTKSLFVFVTKLCAKEECVSELCVRVNVKTQMCVAKMCSRIR